jgi:hypothetical protein
MKVTLAIILVALGSLSPIAHSKGLRGPLEGIDHFAVSATSVFEDEPIDAVLAKNMSDSYANGLSTRGFTIVSIDSLLRIADSILSGQLEGASDWGIVVVESKAMAIRDTKNRFLNLYTMVTSLHVDQLLINPGSVYQSVSANVFETRMMSTIRTDQLQDEFKIHAEYLLSRFVEQFNVDN